MGEKIPPADLLPDLVATWRVYTDTEEAQMEMFDFCTDLAHLVELCGVRCSARLDPPACCVVSFTVNDEADKPKLKRAWELFHDVTVRHYEI